MAELGHALGKTSWRADERLPRRLARGPVEAREHFVAAGVENGEAHFVPSAKRRIEATGKGSQADHRGNREASGLGKRPRGGDSDPQSGEGPRADADRDQRDAIPATGAGDALLDCGQQGARVAGALALWGVDGLLADQRVRLLMADDRDGSCLGRGVDPEHGSRG